MEGGNAQVHGDPPLEKKKGRGSPPAPPGGFGEAAKLVKLVCFGQATWRRLRDLWSSLQPPRARRSRKRPKAGRTPSAPRQPRPCIPAIVEGANAWDPPQRP